MHICICDDDTGIHEEIRKYISAFFANSNIPEISDCHSGEELIAEYSEGKTYDIIFLDIHMQGINGIDTASKIREISPEAIIIFVSSHKDYVFEAFRCEALHFIVKPIKQVDFDDAFTRAMNKYKSSQNFLPLKWQNSRMNIRISDILYVEGFKRHLKVHTLGQTFEAQGNISTVYEELKSHGFLLIHQGYIVNMQYIQRFNSNNVTLENGTEVMMSTRRRADALLSYDRFIQKWKW